MVRLTQMLLHCVICIMDGSLNEDALALCVENGFSLIQPDEYDSPLEIAAQYGNVATVKWMIEHWVQYGQNEAIRYPLREAAEYGQYDVAAYLLSLDAAVEVIDNFSPLSDAGEQLYKWKKWCK